MTETTVERKPPTIADIVREKTDDGARIIDFFLDLMEGRVDGAMLCHRIDAAKQLVKYGSKPAADFIAQHGDETCDHCESRKRGPRPRKDATPAAKPQHAPGPYGYDFLTMLTEDFLTVLSAVDEDLMIMILRAQTRDGGTVIDFLDNVMHGREEGFKPNHRIAAAKELISHILRDEHRSHTSAIPAHKIVVPANAEWNPDNSIVVPAKAGTQRGGEGRSKHDEHNSVVVPAKAGTQRGGEGRSQHDEHNSVVVPAKAGTQRGGEGRSQHDKAPAHTSRKPATAQAGIPDKCQPPMQSGAGTRPRPRQAGAARPANHRKAQEFDRVEKDKAETPAPAELTPAGQRIREKLVAHRHEPVPYGAPIDSTNPGRSPPR